MNAVSTEVSPKKQHLEEHLIEQDLLDLLAKQVRHTPITVVIAMSLVAAMASEVIAIQYWGSWLTLVIVLQIIRWYIFIRLPDMTQYSVQRRLAVASGINAVNTVANSLGFFFFPLFATYERAIQSMISIGMGVVSIITTVGYLPFTLAHVLLGLVPLFSLWVLSPGLENSGLIELIVPFIGFIYALSLTLVSTQIYRMFEGSFNNRIALAKANDQLNSALKEAELASLAKTRFLAAASHDLRQPIHSLSLYCAALDLKTLDEQTREISDHIGIAVESLGSQLDAILDVSKLDAGVVAINKEIFNLHPLLLRIQSDFLPMAKQEKLTLVLDCPLQCYVETDSTLLERIVRNLVGNGLKYTDKGEVTIRVFPNNGRVLLSISDTGRGIPLDEQEQVFEEFYQLDNPERDRRKGLGLGLAIVRRQVDLLGINLKLDSEVGIGSVFTLEMDVAMKENQDKTDTSYNPQAIANLTVLVVDDEPEILHGMRTLLEIIGCTVITSESSYSAITEAMLFKPDIALVDLRLSGTDNGLITIKQLREKYSDLPAIIISGDTEPARLKQVEKAGIQLLHKPVLLEPMVKAIAIACDK